MIIWETTAYVLTEGIVLGGIYLFGREMGIAKMLYWKELALTMSANNEAVREELAHARKRLMREGNTEPDIEAALGELPTLRKLESMPPPRGGRG